MVTFTEEQILYKLTNAKSEKDFLELACFLLMNNARALQAIHAKIDAVVTHLEHVNKVAPQREILDEIRGIRNHLERVEDRARIGA